MNKELTPLEALEILKEANTIYCGCASNLFARYRFEIETIETALKDYENLKLVAKPLTDEEKKSINSVARRLKALEIIKEHIVNISFKYGGVLGNVIKLQIDCDTCYIHFDKNDKNFDLLKEVLK